MGTIKEQIIIDLKEAMKNKDTSKLNALRSIKAKITEAETSKDAKELDDTGVLKVINTIAKQRRQSIEAYENAGRIELVEAESAELSILESFLPKQLSEEELKVIINTLVGTIEDPSIKDMGKVMNEFNSEYSGQADGKLVSSIVREYLN